MSLATLFAAVPALSPISVFAAAAASAAAACASWKFLYSRTICPSSSTVASLAPIRASIAILRHSVSLAPASSTARNSNAVSISSAKSGNTFCIALTSALTLSPNPAKAFVVNCCSAS